MACYLLENPQHRQRLLPLVWTCSVADLRIGCLTLVEKWAHYLQQNPVAIVPAYLQAHYPAPATWGADTLCVSAHVVANEQLATALNNLQPGEQLLTNNQWIGCRLKASSPHVSNIQSLIEQTSTYHTQQYTTAIDYIDSLIAPLMLQAQEIPKDIACQQLQQGLHLPQVHSSNPANIYYHTPPQTLHATLDTSLGPIGIDEDVIIGAGAVIEGPVSLGKGVQIMPQAHIRPNTSIGPYSKIGGTLSHSIVGSYTNKSHEGFIGHSIIGDWCNLGAGTTGSNLKNNYQTVQLFDYDSNSYQDTQQQFLRTIHG